MRKDKDNSCYCCFCNHIYSLFCSVRYQLSILFISLFIVYSILFYSIRHLLSVLFVIWFIRHQFSTLFYSLSILFVICSIRYISMYSLFCKGETYDKSRECRVLLAIEKGLWLFMELALVKRSRILEIIFLEGWDFISKSIQKKC